MRAGIVLLGLKVSMGDVLGLGWVALLLIAGVAIGPALSLPLSAIHAEPPVQITSGRRTLPGFAGR